MALPTLAASFYRCPHCANIIAATSWIECSTEWRCPVCELLSNAAYLEAHDDTTGEAKSVEWGEVVQDVRRAVTNAYGNYRGERIMRALEVALAKVKKT